MSTLSCLWPANTLCDLTHLKYVRTYLINNNKAQNSSQQGFAGKTIVGCAIQEMSIKLTWLMLWWDFSRILHYWLSICSLNWGGKNIDINHYNCHHFLFFSFWSCQNCSGKFEIIILNMCIWVFYLLNKAILHNASYLGILLLLLWANSGDWIMSFISYSSRGLEVQKHHHYLSDYQRWPNTKLARPKKCLGRASLPENSLL